MSGSPFSSFDPQTKKFTHYDEVPSTYGVIIDNQGNTWFAVFTKDGAIGKVDAKTGKVTVWPTNSGPAQRLQVDADGTVWFSGRPRNNIGRLDPSTGTFKTYRFARSVAQPLSDQYRSQRLHVVWLNRSGHDWAHRSQHRPGDRISLPAFRRA